MKNLPWKLISLVLVLLLLVLFGPSLASELIWHRSTEASIFALQLRAAGRDSMQDDPAAWYLNKKAANAGELTLPKDLQNPPSRREYEGMEYYVLNERSYAPRQILYFPGGTYIDRPQAEHFHFADSLASDTGAEVWVLDYPKLSDSSAQVAYELLMDFCRELLAKEDFGELLFMGDSAGGGMALSLAQQLSQADEAGPETLILLSPWLDVAMEDAESYEIYQRRDPKLDRLTLQTAGKAWAGELDVLDPVVSPFYGDCTGLGHIHLYAGTRELLYPDIVRFSQKLDSEGISHTITIGEGMNHIWPLYRVYGVPEAEGAYQNILAAICGQ